MPHMCARPLTDTVEYYRSITCKHWLADLSYSLVLYFNVWINHSCLKNEIWSIDGGIILSLSSLPLFLSFSPSIPLPLSLMSISLYVHSILWVYIINTPSNRILFTGLNRMTCMLITLTMSFETAVLWIPPSLPTYYSQSSSYQHACAAHDPS